MPESPHSSATTVLGLRKLPARYAAVVTPFFLSMIMTCVVALISTLHGVGLTDGLVRTWLGAWGLSWLIAFPVLLFVLPVVRRLTAMFVDTKA